MDPHTHPRVFDALTNDGKGRVDDGIDGKAGLRNYTEVALKSGITAMLAMPNESVRRPNRQLPGGEELVPYPIADRASTLAMEAAIIQNAYIPTGILFGLNPKEVYWDMHKIRMNTNKLYKHFESVQDDCWGLKIYADETTGGNHIAADDVPKAAEVWHRINPEKPIIIHAEDGSVARILGGIARLNRARGRGTPVQGKEIPVHIAHVSSRQELQAVIEAKEAGMNVTCEVTPHHLFLNSETRQQIGPYGCMKPTLKSETDRAFLWANIGKIDMIASDCAPHRLKDKEAENPAFGVTNHTVMMALLFGAVADGKLTMEQLYDKTCIQPRRRFNMPVDDNSSVTYSTELTNLPMTFYEYYASVRYGHNPFVRSGLKQKLRYVGHVVAVQGGESSFGALATSYRHLLTPRDNRVAAPSQENS
jgi:dihydroorotase